ARHCAGLFWPSPGRGQVTDGADNRRARLLASGEGASAAGDDRSRSDRAGYLLHAGGRTRRDVVASAGLFGAAKRPTGIGRDFPSFWIRTSTDVSEDRPCLAHVRSERATGLIATG